MTKAILISGDALRFVEQVRAFERYLVRDLDCNRLDIANLHGCQTTTENVTRRIGEALAEKTATPLLLLFSGRSHEHGWWLDDARSLAYFTLGDLLLSSIRPVLVVSDCDHAMALAERIADLRISPEIFALIGAAEKGEKADRFLGEWLLRAWRKRRPNRLSDALHWGADLDHHFYPPVQSKD